jgi:uncharacterized protein (DUF1778 family)
MTSPDPNVLPLPVDVESLPPLDEPGTDWTQVAGRADEGRRTLIDMAAAKLGKPRAHFVVEAATEKAILILRAA